MAKHTITTADKIYVGNAKHPQALNAANNLDGVGVSGKGVPITIIYQANMGTPVVSSGAADNKILLSSSLTGGTAVTVMTGSFAVAGVANMDVPRAVIAAWTTSSTITVTGKDLYGRVQIESMASPGTAFNGKKAFSSVTSILFSASVTSCTVGVSNILGMPHKVNGKFDFLAFYPDAGANEIATATYVAPDVTAVSAITGDTRGTINPATAPNGSIRYRAWYKYAGLAADSDAYGLLPFGN